MKPRIAALHESAVGTKPRCAAVQQVVGFKEAILYIERNPRIVKSITSFPYIAKSV